MVAPRIFGVNVCTRNSGFDSIDLCLSTICPLSMKYVVLVGDGMADRPLDNGRTPLEEAATPNMDEVVRRGVSGRARTIPDGMPPGSDVANMSLMGYDPRRYYTGRGPLEAASMGVSLDGRVAFRLNLVTEEDGVMADYSADHITTGESRALIEALREELGIDVHAGISYRHILVMDDEEDCDCTPPHDAIGQRIRDIMPRGPNSKEVRGVIEASRGVLQDHPINKRRVERGLNPGNLAWPWGQGPAPDMPTLQDRYGLRGSVVCAVDLIRGLGVYAGLRAPRVEGATGYLDTDYGAKARAALNALKEDDFVFLHVEAPDEAGHMGNVEEKIRAIERFDARVVGPILDEVEGRVLVLPDHATPIEVRTHTPDPVPYAMTGPGLQEGSGTLFSERGVGQDVVDGWTLVEHLVGSGDAGQG